MQEWGGSCEVKIDIANCIKCEKGGLFMILKQLQVA